MLRVYLTQSRLARIAVCAGCLFALLAATADARGSRLRAPSGFFGVVVDNPAAIRPDQLSLMRSSGVETIRVVFNWDQTQRGNVTPTFSALDRTVALASAAGLKILPIVMYTPRWASSRPHSRFYFLYPPRKTSYYTRFLRDLIKRYGPKGSFWRENPGLHKVPIRQWQIWNEPAFNFFWRGRPYYKTYPRLLRAAYKAVHRADHHAKVVTAGLANTKENPSWKYMKRFYRYGFKHSFDILALHPFSATIEHLFKIIRLDRAVLRKNGDGRKSIYLTELSWPASVGHIPKRDYLGFETTTAKQGRLMRAGYRDLLRNKHLRVRAVYWYNWASRFVPRKIEGQEPSFQYAGLVQWDGLSTFTPEPALSDFRAIARKYG